MTPAHEFDEHSAYPWTRARRTQQQETETPEVS